MNEILKSFLEQELFDLLYTWWSFYRLSLISLEMDDAFKELALEYPKEILTCAACLHKDRMSNDNLVNAISVGYAESFLRGCAISVGIFFDSEEAFIKELRSLIKEVRGLQKIQNNYSYIDYTDEFGNKILS